MDKTSRLKLIKTLVENRKLDIHKNESKFVPENELHLSQIQITENDIIDELKRFDSFVYNTAVEPVAEE